LDVLGGAARPSARQDIPRSVPSNAKGRLDDAAMASLLVVDSREAVLKASGDVIQCHATIYAKVGEIFAEVNPVPFRRRL
jgi:hypothetical protein